MKLLHGLLIQSNILMCILYGIVVCRADQIMQLTEQGHVIPLDGEHEP